MVVNNLSVLLLVSVDGLVLGNLVGKNALAAINIFYPATTLIGVASVLVGCGTGTSLAVAVGKGDHDALMRLKSAVKRVMVIAAIVMSVVQVPLVAGIISSYGLDDNMTQMTWQYAMGIMIATPFGLISTVGTYQFQATGNMRWLMRLSIMEGLANLFLDILFVGPLGMGVMGASMGTACANALRCTAIVLILAKTTDIYKQVPEESGRFRQLAGSLLMRGFKHRLRPLEEAVHGLRRGSVTDRRVGPPAVVVGLDELDDGVPRLVPRRPFPQVVHLVLQRGEGRFGDRVAVAAAGPPR